MAILHFFQNSGQATHYWEVFKLEILTPVGSGDLMYVIMPNLIIVGKTVAELS